MKLIKMTKEMSGTGLRPVLQRLETGAAYRAG